MTKEEKKDKKTKGRIIIIDDDEFLLDMYTVKFKEEGYDVESMPGAVQALKKIKDGYDCEVVLVDIIMPTMDGFSFLEKIKEDKLLPDAKKIVLSNLGQQEEIEKALSLGAADYIVKAYFTPSEVVKKVEGILKK